MIRWSFAQAVAALSITLAGCSSHPMSPEPGSSEATALARPDAATSAQGGRAGSTGTVFVTSQGLYYDTFVTAETLPMEGRFQLIEDGRTEFGPGDPGYLGGRWWEDTNDDGQQDAGDRYFLCPLLGPGREAP